jgi:Tat protein translocase TatB subunit
MNILELLIILIIGLIVFKPADLPKVAHQMGRCIAHFRKLFTQFEQRIEDEIKAQRLLANIKKANQAENKQSYELD